jgi:hypothetical protein
METYVDAVAEDGRQKVYSLEVGSEEISHMET